MIKKIIDNLKKPHRIPAKVLFKIKFALKKKGYNKNFYEKLQNEIFKRLNLDRNSGLKKLIKIKEENKFLNREMSSEHEVLFSSLSLNSQSNAKNILEIGTFDGANAYLLSLLFQNSNIETIDLESDKDDFKNFYDRKNQLNKFINIRKDNLSKSKKIFFREMNSVKLCSFDKKYDLIWIDGAHGYPTVCIDIINSLRLINDNGVVLCDDVYKNKIESDKMYFSKATFETLTLLKKENIIDFELIFKRLDADSNSLEEDRKFVAIFKKVN